MHYGDYLRLNKIYGLKANEYEVETQEIDLFKTKEGIESTDPRIYNQFLATFHPLFLLGQLLKNF